MSEFMNEMNSMAGAKKLDQQDALKSFRQMPINFFERGSLARVFGESFLNG